MVRNQTRLFVFVGVEEAEIQAKYGHLVQVLQSGAPPHGGLAIGIDRIVVLALAQNHTHDISAYPWTTSATYLMTEVQPEIPAEQLDDLDVVIG